MTWFMMFMRIGGRKVIVNTLNMSLVRATVTLHTEISYKQPIKSGKVLKLTYLPHSYCNLLLWLWWSM